MKKLTIIGLFAIVALITVDGQSLIQGLDNQIIWGKNDTNEKTLQLNFIADVKPASLTIKLDNPNGIKFLVLFKALNVGVNLNNVISMQTGLNEWGDLEENYFVQVATHDFNEDGNPEIIIAIGDGFIDMSVNIIQYHPPTNSQDAIRIENWSLVENIQAQQKIIIDKQVIIAPFGSQGLFEEYTWVNGKFIKSI
jgi:hypothetical protein